MFMFTYKFTLRFMSEFLLEVITSIPSMLESWNLVCYLSRQTFNFALELTLCHTWDGDMGQYGSKYITDLTFTYEFTWTWRPLVGYLCMLPALVTSSWMLIWLVIRRLQIRPHGVGNILSYRLIMKYFLRSFSSFRSFKKGSCLPSGLSRLWPCYMIHRLA